MNDKKAFVVSYLDDLIETISELDTGALTRAVMTLREARDRGSQVFVCGNGGSASTASHMVVDLLKGASYGRTRRFRIIGLSDSIATITAYANDVDYDRIFVEQLRNFAAPGDILVALSGSGTSKNVIEAVEYANGAGLTTIGLTTGLGGRLREISRLPIAVPSSHMGRLEDCFLIAVHVMCYAFMDDETF